jgi:RimJ/RimL family protein N-acetyltransferase
MFVIEKASKGPRPMRLGVCGLVHWAPRERTAETSFYLGRVDQRKKKYTRRALTLLHRWGYEELDLERIWAEVYAFNGPGLSFLISLGFTEEGRLRSHVFRAGQRHDSVLLGQLRQEFK